MQTYWNTAFTKRDYECTNVIAVKADQLPKGYDPTVWKANGMNVQPTTGGIMCLGIISQNGQRFEQWGYL